MNDHSQKATELFKQGFNCAQSVFASFHGEMGIDIDTALRLSSSFGAGMGRMREVCGAVSAMFMIAGKLYGYADPKDSKAKLNHYTLIQDLASQFKDENGTIICRELLGLAAGPDDPQPEERTSEYYRKRPCAELVGCAAAIIGRHISFQQEERGIPEK